MVTPAPSRLSLPQRRPVSQAVDVAMSATEEELAATLTGPDATLGQEEALC